MPGAAIESIEFQLILLLLWLPAPRYAQCYYASTKVFAFQLKVLKLRDKPYR
jgi:hypothetical protein